ncbi:MAG: cobalamin-dependent protein [Chloroflexota bacterium]
MAQKTRAIKVLMAQFPLETHSRGLITVSGMLKDAGMEVVLIGNELPERIIETAIQEDADVIGISTYCGGELVLGTDLLEAAAARGIKDSTVFLIGGIFPPKDIPRLKEIGFDGVFLTARREEIADCIREALARKRPR